MKLQVYYDGSCPICNTSAGFIDRLDWFNKVELVDLYEPGALEKAGISYKRAIYRIQVKTGECTIYEGIDALTLISVVIPSLWLIAPVLWLAGKIGIGNKVYDWIAKHRLIFPIPGYCKIER